MDKIINKDNYGFLISKLPTISFDDRYKQVKLNAEDLRYKQDIAKFSQKVEGFLESHPNDSGDISGDIQLMKFTDSPEMADFFEVSRIVSNITNNSYKEGLTKIIINTSNEINIPSYSTMFKVGVFLLPTLTGIVGTPDITVLEFVHTFATTYVNYKTLAGFDLTEFANLSETQDNSTNSGISSFYKRNKTPLVFAGGMTFGGVISGAVVYCYTGQVPNVSEAEKESFTKDVIVPIATGILNGLKWYLKIIKQK